MLFTSFQSYLKEKRGALHVGAHEGGERDWYVKQGFAPVVWFEPNKKLFQTLIQNIQNYENQIAYNVGVHDTLKKADLYIASNNGQSSSILNLGTHREHHPRVHYIGKQKIELVRMDDFLHDHTLNINDIFLKQFVITGYVIQFII